MASATPLRASGTARQDNQKENEQPSCNQADAAPVKMLLLPRRDGIIKFEAEEETRSVYCVLNHLLLFDE
jgi:hypothetical protein